MPHFHGKNPVEFYVMFTMRHRQGFMPIYTTCITMLGQRHAEAYQSIKHMMHVIYMGKPMSLANIDRAITHVEDKHGKQLG